MDAKHKLLLYDTAIEFLKLDGSPDSLSDSHIRDSYLRYLKYCDAVNERTHLPEIWFKRVVRAQYFPEHDLNNLPISSITKDLWTFFEE